MIRAGTQMPYISATWMSILEPLTAGGGDCASGTIGATARRRMRFVFHERRSISPKTVDPMCFCPAHMLMDHYSHGATFQTITVLSAAPAAMDLPSGENTTESTSPVC